jgi:hypothetical protein
VRFGIGDRQALRPRSFARPVRRKRSGTVKHVHASGIADVIDDREDGESIGYGGYGGWRVRLPGCPADAAGKATRDPNRNKSLCGVSARSYARRNLPGAGSIVVRHRRLLPHPSGPGRSSLT